VERFFGEKFTSRSGRALPDRAASTPNSKKTLANPADPGLDGRLGRRRQQCDPSSAGLGRPMRRARPGDAAMSWRDRARAWRCSTRQHNPRARLRRQRTAAGRRGAGGLCYGKSRDSTRKTRVTPSRRGKEDPSLADAWDGSLRGMGFLVDGRLDRTSGTAFT